MKESGRWYRIRKSYVVASNWFTALFNIRLFSNIQLCRLEIPLQNGIKCGGTRWNLVLDAAARGSPSAQIVEGETVQTMRNSKAGLAHTQERDQPSHSLQAYGSSVAASTITSRLFVIVKLFTFFPGSRRNWYA